MANALAHSHLGANPLGPFLSRVCVCFCMRCWIQSKLLFSFWSYEGKAYHCTNGGYTDRCGAVGCKLEWTATHPIPVEIRLSKSWRELAAMCTFLARNWLEQDLWEERFAFAVTSSSATWEENEVTKERGNGDTHTHPRIAIITTENRLMDTAVSIVFR